MVAILLHRKQPNYHAEKHEVHVRRKEAAGEQGVIGKIKRDVSQREIVSPTRRNCRVDPPTQEVSPYQQSHPHEQHGRWVQGSGASQGPEAGQHQQKERHLKITLDRIRQRDGTARSWTGGRHGKVLILYSLPSLQRREGYVRVQSGS